MALALVPRSSAVTAESFLFRLVLELRPAPESRHRVQPEALTSRNRLRTARAPLLLERSSKSLDPSVRASPGLVQS